MQFAKSAIRFAALAVAAPLAGLVAGCNKSGGSAEFTKAKSGLEYQLYRKNSSGKWEALAVADLHKVDTSRQLGPNKVMFLNMVQRTPKDSVVTNTYETGMPYPYVENAAAPKSILTEPMRMLAGGDSGVFRVPTDSIFRQAPTQTRPKFLPPGSFVTVCLKAEQVLPMKQAQAVMMQYQAVAQQKQAVKQKEQDAKDATTLADYVAKNNIKAEKLPSGVYVAINQPGTGAKPTPGQVVSVIYKGTLLSGKEFDSSLHDGKQQPYTYPYGQGQVIPGWDEGVGMLTKGAKATILVPSSLGYGPRGSGPIPPNSPLRFDVELADIKAAEPAKPMPMPSAPEASTKK